MIGALWAASVLSSRAERALAKVFDVKRRNVVNRFRAVMITVVLGAVVIGGLVVGAVVQSYDLHGLIVIPAWIVVRVLLLLVEFGYFLLLFKLLTPSKTLRWRDHLPGAILMTLGFGVLKIIGGVLVDRTVAHWSSLYGTIGGIFGLLVIIRLAMWIFMYGAELSSVILRERQGVTGVPATASPERTRQAGTRSISGATDCSPAIDTARNSSSGSPIEDSTSVISSRFTPGANAFSFSFFFTDETFMPVAFSGRTSAEATRRPATASACTTALDIRSVRYCS